VIASGTWSGNDQFDFGECPDARASALAAKKLVIVGNAQHRALRLRVVELIRAGAGFLAAIAPMPGIVKEGQI